MKSEKNIYLIVRPGVVLTPVIDSVIASAEHFFAEEELFAFVTSGLRDAHDQLRVLKKYIKVKGLDKIYPEAMACNHPMDRAGKHYVWQLAWSHLLNIGLIINPPLAAECLMDYYGPTGKGPNRKGKTINQTPHANGVCFDIGGAGGDDATIKDELVVMKRAMKVGIPGLVNILPEHNNNCIHCDCEKI